MAPPSTDDPTAYDPLPQIDNVHPPFITGLDLVGIKHGLMLLRKRFKSTEQRHTTYQSLDLLSPQEKLEAMTKEKLISATKKASSDWYRKVTTVDLGTYLTRLQQDRAGQLGYKTQILWTSKRSTSSYNTLIEAIHSLGAMRSDPQLEDLGTEDIFLRCAQLITSLIHVNAWTLYVWCPILGLPRLIGHHGLYYPEAVSGTIWTLSDIRQRLLSHTGTPLIKELESPKSDKPGSFQSREMIETSYSIIMRSSLSRAVLYLNKRSNDDEPTDQYNISGDFYQDNVVNWRRRQPTIQRPNKIAERIPKAENFGDLGLAVRYLNGWLTDLPEQRQAVAINDNDKDDQDRHQTAYDTAEGLRDCLLSIMGFKKEPEAHDITLPADDTHDLGTRFVGRENELLSYLPAMGDSSAIYLFPCKRNGKEIHIDSMHLKNPSGSIAKSGIRRIELEDDGLVSNGSGLITQSLAWEVSLLIQHPEAEKTPASPLPPNVNRRLADIRLRAAHPWSPQSDAAVPVYCGKKRIGGFCLESSHRIGINHKHIRFLEAISCVVGSLYGIPLNTDETSEHGFFRGVFKPRPAHNPTRIDIFSQAAEWICKTFTLDVTSIVVFDPARNEFVTVGSCLSRSFSDQLSEQLPNRHTRQTAKSSDTTDQYDRSGSVLKEFLRPRPQGRSWNVFISGERKQKCIPRSKIVNHPDWNKSAIDQLSALECLPLRPNPFLSPMGVIWVGRALETKQKIAEAEYLFKDDQYDRLERFGNVIASLDQIHKLPFD